MSTEPDNSLKQFAPDRVLICPSILAADFGNLASDIKVAELAGVDFFHIDVMDGHFVPNISLGPGIVNAIRPSTDLPFDVHLMISHPAKFIDAFVAAGADHITIHIEAEDPVEEVIGQIHSHGCSAGLSFRPDTDPSRVRPYLDTIDLVLAMTVEPGFGGQSFRHDVVPKITQVRGWLDDMERDIHLQIDGGVNNETAIVALHAGANLFVAGTTIFKSPLGVNAATKALRDALTSQGTVETS